MKRISMTAIAFALLACGAKAGATDSTSELIRRDAPKGITEAFYACIDKAGSADIEQAACLSQERERQDHRLNSTYQALLRKLNENQKKGLVDAERSWLKFQDKTSEFEGSIYGSNLVDNLQIEENELFSICRRANELDEYSAIADGL
ncbi:lysozyme inhibitor LprI family protein [Frateuria sp. YIM B11624]|uniref:lysozyme inhibitor LprI family protein n=1 Tax=Frateuria sp. YIM B11624 TaxID=3143185 RepID=UPI003C73104B